MPLTGEQMTGVAANLVITDLFSADEAMYETLVAIAKSC